MRWTGLLLLALVAGCAAARPASATPAQTELTLTGDDTRQHVIVPADQTITPDEADQLLADQEMCYLQLDKITIECFQFGSLLMMGSNDAVRLVSDNPLDDLHADQHDPHGELLLRTLAVLSVVSGSVERLPGALADYIDDTGSLNPGVARTLARRLIDSSSVHIAGMSRLGAFSIEVELTEDGREELREALVDREPGGVRFARHVARKSFEHRAHITTSAAGGGPSPAAPR